MNICFLVLRICSHRKFRLTGPWKRKMSKATLVKGPWVWVETSVTWATWALFFFQHGNMKHQREMTPGTEFHCQQDLLTCKCTWKLGMQKTKLTYFLVWKHWVKNRSRYSYRYFLFLFSPLKRKMSLSFHTPNAKFKISWKSKQPWWIFLWKWSRQTSSDSWHLICCRKYQYYQFPVLLLTRWLFRGLLTSISFNLA